MEHEDAFFDASAETEDLTATEHDRDDALGAAVALRAQVRRLQSAAQAADTAASPPPTPQGVYPWPDADAQLQEACDTIAQLRAQLEAAQEPIPPETPAEILLSADTVNEAASAENLPVVQAPDTAEGNDKPPLAHKWPTC